MGWRCVLVLVVFLIPAIAAQGNADGLQAEINNNNSTTEHSGVRKIGQPDATNANKDKVIDEGEGIKKETSKNHDKDNSKEGTIGRRDEPLKEPKTKENSGDESSGGQSISTEQSSQETDFLREPLVKECDPSHRCIIEKKKFIACLRVPGEDSLALSLLIDNKGMGPLDINIVAPDFVNLDEASFQLKANERKEVSVSISDAANDTLIVLKVAEGTCRLNLHNMITRGTPRVSSYISMGMRLTSTFMLVSLFLLLGTVGLCIKFRRIRNQDGGPAYQKLDTELPVSTGVKKESDQSDQWDNSWGDDWDDEEAPLTPSKPMQNPSLKGLASRRSTKDGWKD